VIRAAAAALALGLGALPAQDAAARVCHFPRRPLASPRDTAAWCAREFLIRNGYTSAPPSANPADIALEPTMDKGLGLEGTVENRRGTVGAEPLVVCTTATGFLVSFAIANLIDPQHGRAVAMTPQFAGITLLRPWVLIDTGIGPQCSVPKLPPA